MGMLPIDRMRERVEVARQDSDTSLGLTFLYFGEMIVKLVAAGLIAAIDDDRERHRYRYIHRLVRSDGIGDWSSAIDEILVGTASQHLTEQARIEQSELTSKNLAGTWQHKSVSLLHKCISKIQPAIEPLPAKVDGRRWLSLFAILRNKTRGHGAPVTELYSQITPLLEDSLYIFVENFRLFQRPWAYLYRNLSGKYRITKFTQPAEDFDVLKTKAPPNSLRDGVYVYFDRPLQVELMYSNIDATDFLFPNGGFNDKRFELMSYITGNRTDGDATPYLVPASPLPASETQGVGILDVQGKSFGNLPPVQKGYIHRKDLEAELLSVLANDRHPVITLLGKGGIGKTWLTLHVLHEIANQERFTAIVWFSARDIDLLPQGPRLVTPHVMTATDMANEFVRLVEPNKEKGFNPVKFLSDSMTKSNLGSVLFVFDNFETVQNPSELYTWIDSFIRLPNKVLITTRFREFKGDYPIEVLGMSEQESDELIQSTAYELGIESLLTDEYKSELYQESGGHPYVMKVLLGELAKSGRVEKIERIVASIENMLDALFERTFAGLSPVAKRVFLTLCTWRSTVPLLALEAVLLRPSNERMDVAKATEELSRSSFIEVTRSNEDGELFLTVPLTASVFGKRKLATSPMKSAIEADIQLLLTFGATQQVDIKHGIRPRVERLFRHVAERVSNKRDSIENYQPMLEFVASKYAPAWLLLAELYQELDSRDLERAKEFVKRYIESTPRNYEQQRYAWSELARLCYNTGDAVGEIHALVETCQLPNVPFQEISSAVNRVNALLTEKYFVLDSEEKRIVSQKLAQVMESRIDEGDANDCSRLAWLFLRLRNDAKAKEIVQLGLSIDPNNIHCKNLAQKHKLY